MSPKKERRERDERRRENRGRRRERPQTIQSHSIFEQGPADTVRKTGGQLLFSVLSFSVELQREHQRFSYRCIPCLTSLCSGWRGTTDLHDSTTSPVCKLVKKEMKESEEDEDEILSKLQRDNVSTSCKLLHLKGFHLCYCASSVVDREQNPQSCIFTLEVH